MVNEMMKMKSRHRQSIADCSDRIRAYVQDYPDTPCDYLTAQQLALSYHRGAYDALAELEKCLGFNHLL